MNALERPATSHTWWQPLQNRNYGLERNALVTGRLVPQLRRQVERKMDAERQQRRSGPLLLGAWYIQKPTADFASVTGKMCCTSDP